MAPTTYIRAFTVGCATALALGWMFAAVASGQSPTGQTVSSTGGGYAFAIGGSPRELPDGRMIEYSAFFSFPAGTVTGTAAAGDLDLAKPVGALRIDATSPFGGQNAYRTSWELCEAASNVSSYSLGAPVTSAGSTTLAWGGAWFDVTCNAGLGFEFFRVNFDADPVFSAEQFDSDHPVEVTQDGGDHQAFIGPAIGGPNVSADRPVAGQVYQQWGAPGLLGTLVAEPEIAQVADVTLCGHRRGEAPVCYAGGEGRIYPRTAGMVHTVQPR